MTAPASTSAAPVGPRRRLLRTALPVLLFLALAVSVAANVLLYRQARATYVLLAEAQLDPYGLKHPGYPPAVPPASGGEALPVVAFVGDSRARDWPAPSAGGYRFVGRGVGGQTTEQVRGRWAADVAPLAPRVVVVQAGINDLKAIPLLPHRRAEIVADCKANLRDVVRRSADAGATVIVTTIFPPGAVTLDRRPVWSADVGRAVEEVNADLRTMAGGRVVVLDAWRLLAGDDGRLRDGYGRDTLHLTAAGYAALNAELAKVLGSMPPAGEAGGATQP